MHRLGNWVEYENVARIYPLLYDVAADSEINGDVFVADGSIIVAHEHRLF